MEESLGVSDKRSSGKSSQERPGEKGVISRKRKNEFNMKSNQEERRGENKQFEERKWSEVFWPFKTA
jgi:hypothetical protein